MQATNETMSMELTTNGMLAFSRAVAFYPGRDAAPGKDFTNNNKRLRFLAGLVLVALLLVGVKTYVSAPYAVDIVSLHQRIAVMD